MSTPPTEDRSRSYAAAPRRRRRFSAWTVIAPAAAIILWVSFFSALGKSCIFKECAGEKDKGSETASDGSDKRNKLPRDARAKVKSGDTLGTLAARFDLTEEELKACNPLVDPQSLQPGQFLVVSAINCEDADKAAAGANPDPLAGDLSTSAPNPAENGTAAADPSAKTSTTETSAEKGDEG